MIPEGILETLRAFGYTPIMIINMFAIDRMSDETNESLLANETITIKKNDNYHVTAMLRLPIPLLALSRLDT
jgi:hypothetical protein